MKGESNDKNITKACDFGIVTKNRKFKLGIEKQRKEDNKESAGKENEKEAKGSCDSKSTGRKSDRDI